ncbi:TetR/AcrR family transcriptional regulator [Rhodococcus fascians]|uniref:TetR/AcrR family transcriptional regulator n=1 Tax=Rhodococcoides fascians TaxID=1828 RepID=UPI0019580948|nr:TetR/AcrR family transcriptional regulator [Rhodococcus fascians]MBM7241585.1 TetR/AcrR family transcriptional regulator [Rhodococcus fascians]MBY3808290.1 TetR/AcrR family transcriptional regulator [Rhodococcus fascians]MBY3839734.1 TetR/AcrR family transcriptional regulator [Rhodococcus fascians]MBY3846597.1 TetR/AcrR family transcriptional regulator [Rhodococcus fascians]MBY3849065.1 TetR/AcrR family transcriptional regulator [Rhodococcus fascians]
MRSKQKILDATLGLIAEGGFEDVTIAAAARAAGVTRQTVYSIFTTREDMISEAMVGLVVDVIGGIRAKADQVETPAEFVVETIVAARDLIRREPVLNSLLRSGNANPLFDPDMMDRATPVVRQFLDGYIERHPDFDSTRFDGIDATLARNGLSVVLFDDAEIRDDDGLRAYLRRWLVPLIPLS